MVRSRVGGRPEAPWPRPVAGRPACAAVALASLALPANAAAQPVPAGSSVTVSRLAAPLALGDFRGMAPPPAVADRLALVEGFVQREPRDGQPASQRTHTYLWYDDEHLYVVFVAFDEEPGLVRARLARRENFGGDDWVMVMLDTFADERRAVTFVANPRGVQEDALWVEGEGFDSTYDTLWHSRGILTDRGFVVWMAIPFRSLRFPAVPEQNWNVILVRHIARGNEESYWPAVSLRVSGRLGQAARLHGLENISPGRNIQLIPYSAATGFRTEAGFEGQTVETATDGDPDIGLDAKLVARDSIVIDFTVNPDFSQVESDSPQVTVNRRFEVFFPEKRPFFLENATTFTTPIDDLVFTRRVLDPGYGGRVTGKLGATAFGAFYADDRQPDPDDENEAAGGDARVGVVRVSRDIFGQSTIGGLFAERSTDTRVNRVAGVDGRMRWGDHWSLEYQAVGSATKEQDTWTSGSALNLEVAREGRTVSYDIEYDDRGPGFRADVGFVPRVDFRRIEGSAEYRVRPDRGAVLAWGPSVEGERLWDHDGTRLDWSMRSAFEVEFARRTSIQFAVSPGRERLRPGDVDGIEVPTDFARSDMDIEVESDFHERFGFEAGFSTGESINFDPPEGEPPSRAGETGVEVTVSLRPHAILQGDHTYIGTRLSTLAGDRIFDNHIFRARWNWQLSPWWSVRVIGEFERTDPVSALTAVPGARDFSVDLLLTRQTSPWTAFYVGYNDARGWNDERGPARFETGSRQLFVKYSRLLQF